MSSYEKLIMKLKNTDSSLTFDELEAILFHLGFVRSNKGKTSGSRVMFVHSEYGSIIMHKPHPSNELKYYQKKQIISKLEQEGLL